MDARCAGSRGCELIHILRLVFSATARVRLIAAGQESETSFLWEAVIRGLRNRRFGRRAFSGDGRLFRRFFSSSDSDAFEFPSDRCRKTDFSGFGLLKEGAFEENRRMIELDSSTVVILLTSCVAMLMIVWFLIMKISWRLNKIEYLLSEINELPKESAAAFPEAATGFPTGEIPQRRAFEIFLSEDPARRRLAKREQFTAYRRWRREKGMNWSNS